MSLNVENLFVKCVDQAKVLEIVANYWSGPPVQAEPDWGLPSSFKPLLAGERKRKLAVSPPQKDWIALIESKEVVDFGLAQTLSEALDTTVLVVQVSEVSGMYGFASAVRGQLLESHLSEDADDPLNSSRRVLKKYDVPFDATLFREAATCVVGGWIVRERK